MRKVIGIVSIPGILLAVIAGCNAWVLCPASAAQESAYVGSAACGKCHEAEYENFTRYAKKSKSYESLKRMQKGLTEADLKGCYGCHTTGYGKPGGFRSEKETPALKNAGCEVCHGPGSRHVESQDPEDVASDLSVDDCKACHNAQRVEAFNFKPLIRGGAH